MTGQLGVMVGLIVLVTRVTSEFADCLRVSRVRITEEMLLAVGVVGVRVPERGGSCLVVTAVQSEVRLVEIRP